MKKKPLSLALALVMCLGLTVPVFAWESNFGGGVPDAIVIPLKAGDVEVTDDEGYTYHFSKPVIGEIVNFTVFSEGEPRTVEEIHYQVPLETVITIQAPDGTPGKFTYAETANSAWDPDDSSFTITSCTIYHLSRNSDLGFIGLYLLGVESTTSTEPEQPTTPAIEVENIPASGTAVASTQTVTVDGKATEFQMYALLDADGNPTNYIKLRDMAYILNGTKAQFSVGYDGTISLTTGQPYEAVGTEMTTPYSGDRAYTGGAQTLKIDGKDVAMTAITLTDDNDGGYNYFKLRDLGKALGFNVSWNNGVIVESDKPYSE